MSPTRSTGAALILAGLASASISGCGGAAPPPSEPPTNDLLELERRLERHQTELEARFGPLPTKDKAAEAPEAAAEPGGGAGGEASEEAPAATPPPPAAPVAESAEVEDSGGDADELSACEVGCQALEGMRRAAARICEVAGTMSEPCSRARTRVGRAEDRVTGAGCSCE